MTGHGLVLIYRTSGVINFAQGAFGMVGAYLFYRATEDRGWSSAPAWLVALAVPAVLGVLTHLLIMSRLRTASTVVRLVSTLAVLFLLVAVGEHIWGEEFETVRSPLPSRPTSLGGGVTIPRDRIWLMAISLGLTVALWAVYRWTRFGQATEAVAENSLTASTVGISPHRVAALNWAVGSSLATLTGVLIAPAIGLGVTSIAFVVLRAVAAALFGQFRSFWVTYVGAIGIGVTESLLGHYIRGPLFGVFTAPSVARSAAFLAIIAVLVVRGRALPARSDLLDRFPALGTGRIHVGALVVSVAVAVVVLLSVPLDWGSAFVVSLSIAIVCLSVVVVTGFVGQLSLAQMALAGFAVWTAGRLNDAHGWPLFAASLAAIAITIPLGVVLALPALRTRGANLAVLTFGMAVVVDELVLRNASLTGGIQGTRIDRPEIFGVAVDAVDHPGRYAVIALACLVGASLVVANVRRGRTGRRMIAVRDNERAAASLGINVAAVKMHAFALAAGLAAVGGLLLAFRNDHVNFSSYAPFASIEVLIYAVIGGVAFVIGPLFAAPLAAGGVAGELITSVGLKPTDLDWLSAIVLILILLANPNGLAHENVRIARRLRAASLRHDNGPRPRPSALPLRRADPSDPPALAVHHVTVRFGGIHALDDISLEVRRGEVVGLVGPNGAGKTTLIDAMTGFTRPLPGARLAVYDRDVTRLAAHQRARLGLARSFQSLELFEDMTVRENIQTACDGHSVLPYVADLVRPGAARLSEAATRAVDQFGLADELDQPVSSLPHGRRRVVAIARAVATSPRVLLLDEPAAGLSEVESAELGRLIGSLAHGDGLAVVLVEHDMPLVLSICDRVAVLNFGRKLAEGTPEAIAADPVVIEAYLG